MQIPYLHAGGTVHDLNLARGIKEDSDGEVVIRAASGPAEVLQGGEAVGGGVLMGRHGICRALHIVGDETGDLEAGGSKFGAGALFDAVARVGIVTT